MDKMSIYWLVIMAVLIFSIRSLKLCCKKDIVTVKINKKIKNIFEKILDKKKYVLAGMFFFMVVFGGRVDDCIPKGFDWNGNCNACRSFAQCY